MGSHQAACVWHADASAAIKYAVTSAKAMCSSALLCPSTAMKRRSRLATARNAASALNANYENSKF